MQKREVERLVSSLALQIPRLFRRTNYIDAEIYDDTAVLEFKLPNPMDIEDFLDELDDQIDLILLYHVVPSAATRLGQRCAAYSNPSFPDMYKVNAVSDDNGEIDVIHITLYESLMTMGMEVRGELVEMTGKYKAEYSRKEADVLRDFMR